MLAAPPLITSRANPRVKQLRAALTETARPSDGLIGIEGPHLVDEALRSRLPLHTLFLAEDRPAPANLPAGVEVLRLSDPVFRGATATRCPQGIAALLPPPIFSIEAALVGWPLLLVLDALQDPGNLGALVRSAEAFGATGMVLLPGSAGIWNGKALRASAGSAFRLPSLACSLDCVGKLRECGVQLLAAVGRGTPQAPALPPGDLDLARPTAFLIGNEGAGLSRDLLALADRCVTIPCSGPVESLNAAVAGSLLLFAAQQQRGHRPPTGDAQAP